MCVYIYIYIYIYVCIYNDNTIRSAMVTGVPIQILRSPDNIHTCMFQAPFCHIHTHTHSHELHTCKRMTHPIYVL